MPHGQVTRVQVAGRVALAASARRTHTYCSPYTTIWLALGPPGQIGDFIPAATDPLLPAGEITHDPAAHRLPRR